MRRIPRWVLGVFVAAIILAGLLALAPVLLNAERYRSDLVKLIEDATGGTAEIGTLRLRLFPTAGFTVEKLTVRGASTEAGASLSIETVHGRFALRPLWHDEFRITSIDVANVRITWPGLAPLDVAVTDLTVNGSSASAKLATKFGSAAEIAGTVTIDDWNTPVAHFDFTMPLLDIGQWASTRSGRPPSVDSSGQLTAPRTLIAQGRVQANRVRLPPLEATGAIADVKVYNDHVDIGPVSMAFYDGMLGLVAHVDRTVRPARFGTTINVQQASLANVLTAFGAGGQVTGTAEMSLSLNGSFGDGLLDSLTGNGTLTARDGILPGFDGNGMMGAVAKLQNAVTFGAGTDQFAKEIPYQMFGGDVVVDTRQVRSKRLVLESAAGTVSLHGNTGFDHRLDYEGLAALLRSRPPSGGVAGTMRNAVGSVVNTVVGRVRVPFSIRGTLSNPKVGPKGVTQPPS